MKNLGRIGQKVWFHDEEGGHFGYIEQVNISTIDVLEDDENNKEGFQRWRISEFFISNSPEEAKTKWDDYQFRFNEYNNAIKYQRKANYFERGYSVIVQSMKTEPYKGMVLNSYKTNLDIVTESGKFMRVDRCLCVPTNEQINFEPGVFS
jgi:hypothetical protein